MNWKEFKSNVEQWAQERGIYEHSTPQAQLLKALSEALQAIGVSYELIVNYGTDSYRPKVYAPRYINKEYVLNLWYSTSLPIEDVHNDVMLNLANKYGIRKESVWTSS